ASADAILYEFDPQYRRRISRMRQQSERSFGASLRRLRKQRGLRREDFEPEVTGKTIARIEQGVVRQVHKKTLDVIAKRLRVTPAEIESF
ncbi:MAG: helix-turn-helix domain-containing protein, partial [Planctomycetaceae bacterium]